MRMQETKRNSACWMMPETGITRVGHARDSIDAQVLKRRVTTDFTLTRHPKTEVNDRTCFAGNFGDRPHGKTGATALHVAAAKGYIKVINLLIQAGGEINQQVGGEEKCH